MCCGLDGIKCQQATDVSKCTHIVVAAADHFGDVAIHCQSCIESDTQQLDVVVKWHHWPRYIDITGRRKLFWLGSSAEPTASVLGGLSNSPFSRTSGVPRRYSQTASNVGIWSDHHIQLCVVQLTDGVSDHGLW